PRTLLVYRRPIEPAVEKRIRLRPVDFMRTVEPRYTAFLRDAERPIQFFHAAHLDVCEPPRRHDHAILRAGLNHEGAGRHEHPDLGVIEMPQQIEAEHIEYIGVEQERRALGQITGLDIPIIEMSAGDHYLEARLGRSGP